MIEEIKITERNSKNSGVKNTTEMKNHTRGSTADLSRQMTSVNRPVGPGGHGSTQRRREKGAERLLEDMTVRTCLFDTNPRSSQYEELSETHTNTCVRNQGLKAASNSSSIRVSANFSAETLDARKQWDERKKLSTKESTSRKNTLQKNEVKAEGVHCKQTCPKETLQGAPHAERTKGKYMCQVQSQYCNLDL